MGRCNCGISRSSSYIGVEATTVGVVVGVEATAVGERVEATVLGVEAIVRVE